MPYHFVHGQTIVLIVFYRQYPRRQGSQGLLQGPYDVASMEVVEYQYIAAVSLSFVFINPGLCEGSRWPSFRDRIHRMLHSQALLASCLRGA